jgi:hypothetical protein
MFATSITVADPPTKYLSSCVEPEVGDYPKHATMHFALMCPQRGVLAAF